MALELAGAVLQGAVFGLDVVKGALGFVELFGLCLQLSGAFLPRCCDVLLGFGYLLAQLTDNGRLGEQLAIPAFQLADQGVELVDVGVGGLADHGQVSGE
ncbi:hypothetical protein D3C84_1036790 [compost metagenome]